MSIDDTVASLAAAATKAAKTNTIDAPITDDEITVVGGALAKGLHGILDKMHKIVVENSEELNAEIIKYNEDEKRIFRDLQAPHAAPASNRRSFAIGEVVFAATATVALACYGVAKLRGKNHAEKLERERAAKTAVSQDRSR